MVASVTGHTPTPPNGGYDGVVRILSGGYYGTGALLYDGHTILTATHLFEGNAGNAAVYFETIAGIQAISASSVTILSGYDPVNINNDLALVRLSQPAPIDAERYQLYRDTDELNQVFDFAGYGIPGTGAWGVNENYTGEPFRQHAYNRFEILADNLKSVLGSLMGWTPLVGSQLVADFDNGTFSADALGRLAGINDRGIGEYEGILSPGDSGGPAFINGQIAGVASYGARLANYYSDPDIDWGINSSFGEISAWQRVSYYQQWIDQNIRTSYSSPPHSPDEVQLQVNEDAGTISYAYFLLEFNGIRDDSQGIISIDYVTRDGSAVAGLDYLANSGTLNLYPGENEAVIAVEIINDPTPEPDEVFYLDIFNPVGGSFGSGITQLTASRTISANDGWLG